MTAATHPGAPTGLEETQSGHRAQVGPDEDVAARLRIVIARLSRRLKPTAAAGALTTTEVDVLGIVGRQEHAVKLSELAMSAGLNPTMLSRLVGKLEAQGLLRRIGDDSDGRVWRVELTPHGRRLHEKVRKERAVRISNELDWMTTDNREAVLNALPALEMLAERLLDR